MPVFLQDMRYAIRMLTKNPGFTAVVVLTLALGIGANSTIFTWVNSALLNPVPGAARPKEIVSVMRGERSLSPTPPFSTADYRDLRDRNRSFSGLLAFHNESMGLTGIGKPQRVWGTLVSANFFDVLGVRPLLGRGFLAPEEQKPEGAPVVVLNYGLWKTRFGGDRSIVGETIHINQHPYTVVGVVPREFQGCMPGLRSDLWIPLVMDPVITGWHRYYERGVTWLNVFGRLKPGVTERQAQEELDLLMQRVVADYPNLHKGPNEITLDPLWRSPFGANSYLHTFLPILMSLSGIVLLLACANVANLLLVRLMVRRRELAIRLSMGASRWRLARQLLIESLLLALTGGGIAILLTAWTADTIEDFIPPTGLPLIHNNRIDHTMLLATSVISILTGVIFSTLPALRSSKLAPVTVLKEEAGSVSGGLHKSRLASALVVAQIALSLFLLISAGLFIRSFESAQRIDPGFDPDHVLLTSYDLKAAGYSEANGIEFDRQLLAKLKAVPAVESVTLTDWVPLGFDSSTTTIDCEGYVPRPHESMETTTARVGPNYLGTMRIPLVAGRDFTLQDNEKSQRVAIVNQALVDRYWPGQDAIGKRLEAHGQTFTVVGVARTGKYHMLNETPHPAVYLSSFQDYYHDTILQARVSGDPEALASTVERTIHQLNADMPMFDMTTLKSRVQISTLFERIAGIFVGTFGMVALVLAAVGIYGVVSHSTRQRTHEIGIRMALGAQRDDILRLVVGQGLVLSLMGSGFGFALSLAVTRFLRNELFVVTATDPLTFGGVTLLLCVVALAACYIPARRAMKVDPMVALRYE
jgi:predicted permease